MSLLERMRSGSDSTFMQVIFAMIIVAFVGVYAQTSGERSNAVAVVNGVKIMDTEHGRVYRNALAQEENRAQRTLSDAEQKQLWEQVRQQMIEGEVMLQEAHRLGLEVSDAEVARALRGLDFLWGEDGTFDKEAYQSFLRRQRVTKSDFEKKIREDLLRNKLQELVYTGASLSEPAMRDAYVEAETRVDLTLVRIRPSAFEDDVTITDEERKAWLAENEALVEETYERDLARLYDHPEQVRLRMIRLARVGEKPTLPELVGRLHQLRDEIAGGADMAALARRWSEDPSAVGGGDVGLRPVARLTTEEAQAVEDLDVGEVSRPVVTDRDVRLLKLEERIAAKVDSLDEVRNSIADSLIRAERVPVLAAQFAEERLLKTWRETGVVPDELLAEQGLSAQPTGPIPTSALGNPFAPPQRLLDAARTAEVGAVIDEVFEEGGVYYVAQLTERTEPDLARLEEEEQEIRERMLLTRRNAFYQAWLADVKSRATIR